jgi:hypothetical protein
MDAAACALATVVGGNAGALIAVVVELPNWLFNRALKEEEVKKLRWKMPELRSKANLEKKN